MSPELAVDVDVDRATAAPPADADFVRWVAAVLAEAPEDAADALARGTPEVSIRIVDADEGRALNAQWRGRDHATNVLSFPADLPPELDVPLLGDLVLCAPVVADEAQTQGKTEIDHWAHLVVHGLLHLLGHDHQDDGEAERMESLEVRILAGLGIGDPYAVDGDRGPA